MNHKNIEQFISEFEKTEGEVPNGLKKALCETNGDENKLKALLEDLEEKQESLSAFTIQMNSLNARLETLYDIPFPTTKDLDDIETLEAERALCYFEGEKVYEYIQSILEE